MKKLFTVTLLAGLLSMPSVVFAEASWYGSIRAGVASTPHAGGGSSTGVSDGGSRWGIKGSSEVSEGLTAVYRYERKIDSTSASEPQKEDGTDNAGRLSYVGLTGGFGSITVGQVWSASYNSVGAITDNSFAYGSSETSYRVGDAVSYAVSMGNVSLQADAIMDSGTKKTGDSFQVGATLGGLMETGSIAVAHISHADAAAMYTIKSTTNTPLTGDAASGDLTGMTKSSSNFIAGQYGVGGMTMYLGAGQTTTKTGACIAGAIGEAAQDTERSCTAKKKDSTTFAGVRGGVGDTGVSYVFQVRSKNSKSNGYMDTDDATETATHSKKKKTSPWILGISRSLGGGASVHFETADPDEDGVSNSSGLWLKVDF